MIISYFSVKCVNFKINYKTILLKKNISHHHFSSIILLPHRHSSKSSWILFLVWKCSKTNKQTKNLTTFLYAKFQSKFSLPGRKFLHLVTKHKPLRLAFFFIIYLLCVENQWSYTYIPVYIITVNLWRLCTIYHYITST